MQSTLARTETHGSVAVSVRPRSKPVASEPSVAWPKKQNIFGVQVTAAGHEALCDAIMSVASKREPGVVSAFAVHALIEACTSRELNEKVNRFSAVTADGQPIRWALHWLYGTKLKSTVQGFEVMSMLCERAAKSGVSIYLYGSSEATLAALKANLLEAYPGLIIAGIESPPFRPLTPEEDAAMVERVNASGAGLVFIGLGCPKQDHFAAAHVDRIRAVQLCVGAAFDFLAGTKPIAPLWMQRAGLAWVFRLTQEPQRLWKRYLVTNAIFLRRLAGQFIQQRILSRWPEELASDVGTVDPATS
jgi:N-acetylglucosaminyldiphosphoundecaprenol N-acetyl-beta-D-mannosaminyltransferase